MRSQIGGRRLYQILEHGTIGDRTGAAVARLIIGLIVVNLIAVALKSVPEFELRYESLFTAIEFWSLVLFTVEYGLRIGFRSTTRRAVT